MARDEPLHPKYTKRASDREKTRGRRYQLIAINAAIGQVAWLDARHRSHVHVEDDVKQAKAIGLNRWPSRHWKVNVAWTAVVAMAASLLAAFRHLGLPDGDLRKASVKTLRFRLFEVPGRITKGQRRPGCTCQPTGPGPQSWPPPGRRSRACRYRLDPTPPTVSTTRSAVPRQWKPAPPTRPSDHDAAPRTEPMIIIWDRRLRDHPVTPMKGPGRVSADGSRFIATCRQVADPSNDVGFRRAHPSGLVTRYRCRQWMAMTGHGAGGPHG